MKALYTALFLVLGIHLAKGQVYTLDYNNCSFNHPLGSATSIGNVECTCGVINQGLKFDGIDDGVILPDTVLTFMKKDFTIDFYIDIKNTGDNQIDIISIGDNCGIDSFITINYLQQSKEIFIELFVNNGIYFPIKAKIDDKTCWNRVTFVRSELNYILYINNKFAGKAIATQEIPFAKKANFAISNSPCLTSTDARFDGRFDQLKVYDRALAEREISQSFDFPERFFSNDTTISKGSSVSLVFGNTCASTFEWTPNTNLVNPTNKEVIASPEVTTTYTITASGDECITSDKVTIYVIDPDKIDCKKLLLPSAFTPNGDRINDVYKISNIFLIEEMKSFEILDRWGEILYRTTDKNEGWDGYYASKRAEPSQYIYRVNYTCKGEEYNKMGSFVLVK